MERKCEEEQETVIIRTAEPADFEEVRVLEELEFSFHRKARPDYFRDLRNSYSEEEFTELLSHPCPIALVAIKGGKLAGICFGIIEETSGNSVCKPRRIAFIQDVVTRPEYRGRGIATALMEKARRQAIQAGAVSMELCAWGFNEKALRLYDKMGMKVQYYRMEEDLANG